MNRAAIVGSFTCVVKVSRLLLYAAALSACSTSAPEAPARARPVPGQAPGGHALDRSAVRTSAHPSVLDSLRDLDDTPEPALRTPEQTVGQVASQATLDAVAPAHGCVALTQSATRVLASGGPASIAAAPGGFVVAGYVSHDTAETVVVVRLSPSSATVPLATLSLGAPARPPRSAPPTVTALDSGRVLIAATDAHGAVRAVALGVSSPTMRPELRALGSGADLRFAPAVASLRGGAAAIAYTDGSATPMRVRLIVVRPDLSTAATHDVTPPSLGASAPVFDRYADSPTLVFLDAHGGLSPVVRLGLAEDGTPGAAQIDRPLSTVSEPARLAAAHLGPRRFVAYTAIGRAATSAIGLVELGGTLPVVPLVPGEGYGVLQVSGVSAPAAAIFVMTRPVPGVAATERFNGQVLVRLVDDAGVGPALVVTDAEERASYVALARADDATVGVAYTTSAGVDVRWLRCADR